MLIPDYVDLKLQIEEMYFDAATNAFAQANSFREFIRDRRGALSGLHLGEAYDWGDEIDLDEEMLEDIEKAADHLAEAFGRFMQSVSLTHILCAMCLEARINLVADKRLAGKAFEAFDKLSLEGKWLLLPSMLTGTGLDPGKQPFQGFSELVRRRNNLVHPKGSELLRLLIKSNDPNSLLETGLQDAANALDTTKAMIAELATLLSETRPPWIDGREYKFYRLTVSQHEIASGESLGRVRPN